MAMGPLPGTVVGGVEAFMTASFEHIRNDLLQSRKQHLPNTANNIRTAISRTPGFNPDVPAVLDNMRDRKGVVVRK